MARITIIGMDETIRSIEQLGENAGPVVDAMLRAGAQVASEEWEASGRRHHHIDTGQMIASIGFSGKIKNSGGVKSIDVFPQGKDHKGVRNVEKAFVLNYGARGRAGSHWVDEANSQAEPKVATTMQAIWDEYITTGNVRQTAAVKKTQEKREAREYATTKYHGEGRSAARGAANRTRAENRKAFKRLYGYTPYEWELNRK